MRDVPSAPAPLLASPPAPRLRAFGPGDADAVARLAGDPAIGDAMISVPHPLDPGDAAALLAGYAAEEARGAARHRAVCWAAPDAALDGTAPAEDVVVGGVSLRHVDAEHRQAELSFWVGRPWWGRGLAPAAAAAALRLAFDDRPGGLGLHRVEAYHMVRNAGSERVLARLGFRREGVLRQRVWKWGRPEDVVAYALLRDEYLADARPPDGA
jgi:RimJ/RimL family protein N-acetyltransferase